jgi:hypothetical protein
MDCAIRAIARGSTRRLVAYCSKVSIPVPRNSNKAIRVTQEGGALQIALDTFPCERSLSFQMPPMAMPWSRRYPL